jgi:hypothetical protein
MRSSNVYLFIYSQVGSSKCIAVDDNRSPENTNHNNHTQNNMNTSLYTNRSPTYTNNNRSTNQARFSSENLKTTSTSTNSICRQLCAENEQIPILFQQIYSLCEDEPRETISKIMMYFKPEQVLFVLFVCVCLCVETGFHLKGNVECFRTCCL